MKNFRLELKENIKKSKVTIGSWITMADPITTEVMCQAGFDWLTVDMEHSALTLEQAQNHIRIIELYGIPALVRVGENDATLIKRVMDAGASGVIVPMVNTKQDALRVVKAVRYPPVGSRGVGLARAQGYGLAFEQYKKRVNQESIIVVQIEHIEAVNNLEDILTVEGIDAFIVGPFDLSASLGFPGEFKHPKVMAALKRIRHVSKALKIPAGFHVIPPDEKIFLGKVKEGFSFLAFSLDTLILGTSCRRAVNNLRKSVK